MAPILIYGVITYMLIPVWAVICECVLCCMVYAWNSLEFVGLIMFYLLSYNCAILLFFYVILQVNEYHLANMNQLGRIGGSFWFIFGLLVAILSMAGIPPMWGFLAKLLIFVICGEQGGSLMYLFLFVLLFTGLIFYAQNVRFLYSSNSLPILDNGVRTYMGSGGGLVFFILLFLTIFSIFFYDDLFLIFYWLLL